MTRKWIGCNASWCWIGRLVGHTPQTRCPRNISRDREICSYPTIRASMNPSNRPSWIRTESYPWSKCRKRSDLQKRNKRKLRCLNSNSNSPNSRCGATLVDGLDTVQLRSWAWIKGKTRPIQICSKLRILYKIILNRGKILRNQIRLLLITILRHFLTKSNCNIMSARGAVVPVHVTWTKIGLVARYKPPPCQI